MKKYVLAHLKERFSTYLSLRAKFNAEFGVKAPSLTKLSTSVVLVSSFL